MHPIVTAKYNITQWFLDVNECRTESCFPCLLSLLPFWMTGYYRNHSFSPAQGPNHHWDTEFSELSDGGVPPVSQWQSSFAVRDWRNCSLDLVMLRKLTRLTMQWKMNQIRNLYSGNFQCEVYSKNTVLLILFNIKGNSMRELINCLTYSWRLPFNWIYFCSISI